MRKAQAGQPPGDAGRAATDVLEGAFLAERRSTLEYAAGQLQERAEALGYNAGDNELQTLRALNLDDAADFLRELAEQAVGEVANSSP